MMWRSSVEKTLNALLDAGADELRRTTLRALAGQGRYASGALRAEARDEGPRRDAEVPKLRSVPFETVIIQRYPREEALVEGT